MNKVDKITKEYINRQLATHGVDFDYVMDHQIIGNKSWYEYYTITQELNDELYDWLKKELKKAVRIQKIADINASMIHLNYGLRIK